MRAFPNKISILPLGWWQWWHHRASSLFCFLFLQERNAPYRLIPNVICWCARVVRVSCVSGFHTCGSGSPGSRRLRIVGSGAVLGLMCCSLRLKVCPTPCVLSTTNIHPYRSNMLCSVSEQQHSRVRAVHKREGWLRRGHKLTRTFGPVL